MSLLAADQSDEGVDLSPEEAPMARSGAAAIKDATSIRQRLKLFAPPGQNMPQPDFLLVLHAATCGKQGPESGSDEAPICQLAFLVYNVQRKKVILARQLPVKPLMPPGCAASDPCGREDGRAAVSDECRLETGATEELLDTAGTLGECLAELDRALCQAGLHPDAGGHSLRLITDGQATLRLLLHPEASAKQLALPEYFYGFCDLGREFSRAYGNPAKGNSTVTLAGMLTYLGLEPALDTQPTAGLCIGHCLAMSRIISCLLNDGHQFLEPEIINKVYCPAVSRQSDPVDAETVARVRGLPWQAGDADVASFFSGLNVRPGGVALVLSRTGRRNGEALIRFESSEHRDLALLRHRHHLGQRYIEVFKAAARDFLAVAAVQSTEAEAFLVRLEGPGQQLVRMRGLPYTVTAEQVLEFFDKSACPVQFGQLGLFFAQHSDGRATGDAFVLFESAEAAERALLRGHRQHIGSRYVELFKSTPAELNQVLGGYQKRRLGSPAATAPSASADGSCGGVSGGGQPHLIRIRGMPAETTVADILGFLEQHAVCIAFQGVHQVLNHLGQPTGEAVIEMTSERAVQLACEAKDGRQFRLACGLAPRVDVRRCSLSAEVPPSPPPPLHVSPLTLPPPPPPPPLPPLPPPHPPIQRELLPTAALMAMGQGPGHMLPHFPTVLALQQSPYIAVPSMHQYFPACPQPAAVTAYQISQCLSDGILPTRRVIAI